MENKIEVCLPKDMAGEYVTFTKEGEAKQTVIADESGKAEIQNVEEGTYLIEITDTSEYEFVDSFISVPLWSEEKQNMLYNITVVPKYTRISEPSPATGDETLPGLFLALGIISLLIVAIMTCHKQFKCGRMSDKYLRKRRRT